MTNNRIKNYPLEDCKCYRCVAQRERELAESVESITPNGTDIHAVVIGATVFYFGIFITGLWLINWLLDRR